MGTWGGDYQNLIQKNIATPLLQPKGVEVIYDTANDSGAQDQADGRAASAARHHGHLALDRAGSYEMFKAGTLEEIDYQQDPERQHVPAQARDACTRSRTSFTGRVILYNPKFDDQRSRPPTPISGIPRYAAKVGIIDIQYQTTIESAALINGGSLHELRARQGEADGAQEDGRQDESHQRGDGARRSRPRKSGCASCGRRAA